MIGMEVRNDGDDNSQGTDNSQSIIIIIIIIIYRCSNEARILSELAPHPHVVHIFGVAVLPPSVCIVLELCAFGSLADVLRCGMVMMMMVVVVMMMVVMMIVMMMVVLVVIIVMMMMVMMLMMMMMMMMLIVEVATQGMEVTRPAVARAPPPST